MNTLFISYATEDKLIAVAIANGLNDAFRGELVAFLSQRMLPGVQWKEEIKAKIEKSFAVVSIITGESIKRPWIYIEWTPFWMADKKTYILLDDSLTIDDLVAPMKDIQSVTRMTDPGAIQGLLESIAKEIGYSPIPFSAASGLASAINEALSDRAKKLTAETYAQFRYNMSALPKTSTERRQIAKYFYDNHELDVFLKIASEIRDTTVKFDMAEELIDDGDLGVLADFIPLIQADDRLRLLVLRLIERELTEEAVSRQILDQIDNEEELLKIYKKLLLKGKESSMLFRTAFSRFNNMVAVRKLACEFVHDRKHESPMFDPLIDILVTRNRIELRKLAMEFVAEGLEDSDRFKQVVRELARTSQSELRKLFQELGTGSPPLSEDLLQFLESGEVLTPEDAAQIRKIVAKSASPSAT